MKFKKNDRVLIYPYGDNQIEVMGYITQIGRAIISKKKFIRIRGIKLNSAKETIYFSMKVYEWDFHKIIRLTKQKRGSA